MEGRQLVRGQAHLSRANDFALVHRDAADHLGGIFTDQKLGEKGFDLTELAVRSKAIRPVGDFAKGLGIGGVPSKAVNRMLLAIERLAIHLAIG